MKKILLILGTITTTIFPIVTIISCGEDNNQEQNVTKLKIENMNPKQLLTSINSVMQIFMKENASKIIKSEQKLKNYINGIKIDKAKFILEGYNKTHTLNLTIIKNTLDEIKQVLKLNNEDRISTNNVVDFGLQSGVIASTLIAKQTTFNYGYKIANFMTLMKKIKIKRNANNKLTNEIIEKHPYINMLKKYHEEIWKFVQSNLYKEWIKGKKFNVFLKNKPNEVQPGQFMDDQNAFKDTFPVAKIKNQYSNFEGQFIASILNIGDN